MVRHLPLMLEVPGSTPSWGEKNFGVRTRLVSFAGMTLDKCIILRIETLTGCPLCRKSHPLCRLKNPTVILIWLLVGFHPATRSVQSTPANNTRKRVWQYIENERYDYKTRNVTVMHNKTKTKYSTPTNNWRCLRPLINNNRTIALGPKPLGVEA